MTRVAVLGAGAWGTAMACVLAARLEVSLWTQRAEQSHAIAASRRNERYLPGIEVPASVRVTSELARAVEGAQLCLAATPVAGLRDFLQKIEARRPVIWLCKGLEEGSALLPHQVAQETLDASTQCGVL